MHNKCLYQRVAFASLLCLVASIATSQDAPATAPRPAATQPDPESLPSVVHRWTQRFTPTDDNQHPPDPTPAELKEMGKQIAAAVARSKGFEKGQLEEYVKARCDCAMLLWNNDVGMDPTALGRQVMADCLPYIGLVSPALGVKAVDTLGGSVDAEGMQLTAATAPAWRKRYAKALLEVWQNVADADDPTFVPFDKATMLSFDPLPPPGYPTGVDPKEIKEPDVRKKYEAYLADRMAQNERRLTKTQARELLIEYTLIIERDLSNTYGGVAPTPDDWEILQAYLRIYVSDPALRREFYEIAKGKPFKGKIIPWKR
jgi:hypothetical protein